MGKVTVIISNKFLSSSILKSLAICMIPEEGDWHNGCIELAGVTPAKFTISISEEKE